MEKWEDRRDSNLSRLCLVGRVENFFIWLGREMGG